MMSQIQQQQKKQKSFTCFACEEVVRLKRKPDNNGWLRFNLDGTTEHQCAKKNNNKNKKKKGNVRKKG